MDKLKENANLIINHLFNNQSEFSKRVIVHDKNGVKIVEIEYAGQHIEIGSNDVCYMFIVGGIKIIYNCGENRSLESIFNNVWNEKMSEGMRSLYNKIIERESKK